MIEKQIKVLENRLDKVCSRKTKDVVVLRHTIEWSITFYCYNHGVGQDAIGYACTHVSAHGKKAKEQL